MSPSTPPENKSHSSKHDDDPAFGWTAYAEKINGRFAMIGLVSLLILEILTHQDFLTWLGLR